MTKVVGVRFRQVGKIYFFAPGKYSVETGQHVIVETARGVEYGQVVLAGLSSEIDTSSLYLLISTSRLNIHHFKHSQHIPMHLESDIKA